MALVMNDDIMTLVVNQDRFLHYNLTDIRTICNKSWHMNFEQICEHLDNIIANNTLRPDGKPMLRHNTKARKPVAANAVQRQPPPLPMPMPMPMPPHRQPAAAAAAAPPAQQRRKRPLQPPPAMQRQPLIQLPHIQHFQRQPLIQLPHIQHFQNAVLWENIQWGVDQQFGFIRQPKPAAAAKKVKQEPDEECGCCMMDTAPSEMTACINGHKVCNKCIKRTAATENAIVGKTKIECLCMSANCTGWYSDTVLEKLLDTHIYKYYQHNKRDAEIMEIKKALDDDNIQFHKCAHCDSYMDIIEPVLNATNNKIHCVYCLYDTCVKCDVLYQPGHVCVTEEEKNYKSKMHRFEELETYKLVCKCACKRELVKTEGCNKLTCVCKRIMCWCCKKDISKVGYGHFCAARECSISQALDKENPVVCQKTCHLFTKTS